MTAGQVVIVADDLTGAADAAVAFAAHGKDTRVIFDPEAVTSSEGEVVAVSINSRDVDESELKERNAPLFRVLEAGGKCFRKLDSMFRGNTIAEIALLARRNLGIPIVVAPAYPALGRQMIDGKLIWRDHTQQGTFDIRDLLEQRGVKCTGVGVASSLVEALSGEKDFADRIFLCDALTQEDLERIAAEEAEAGARFLWCGSGGLARALASREGASDIPSERSLPEKGPVLFCIGSNHPVTLRQLQSLRNNVPENAAIVEVPRGQTDAQDIRSAVQEIPGGRPACIFMTGGDTAMFVCNMLGISELLILSEIAPGVPLARILGGMFDGVDAVLKSGGFGEPGLLRQIAERYRNVDGMLHA